MEKNMADYIRETPEILLNIIEHAEEYTEKLTKFYKEEGCEGLILIASGSSYNGALMAKPFLKAVLKTAVELYTPFTFEMHESDHIAKQMIIVISQSGCSTNIISVLKKLREKGHKTLCLTGRDDCDARDYADVIVNWQVKEEKIGFVTKGVSSLACFLMCFALQSSLKAGSIPQSEYDRLLKEMKKTQVLQPQIVEKTIAVFEKHKEDFLKRSRVILLSSGPNFATASEGALKICETSCIDAFAYEAEEFLHGPLYPSKPDDLIILIDNNDDPSSQRIRAIAAALRDITSKVYVLGDAGNIPADHLFSTTEETLSLVSPLYKLSCLQMLAYLMSENSNHYEPHECVKKFKKANKVASKSRSDLYLDLQKIN